MVYFLSAVGNSRCMSCFILVVMAPLFCVASVVKRFELLTHYSLLICILWYIVLYSVGANCDIIAVSCVSHMLLCSICGSGDEKNSIFSTHMQHLGVVRGTGALSRKL